MTANFRKQDMKTIILAKINNLIFVKQGTSNVKTKKIFSVIVKHTSIIQQQQGDQTCPNHHMYSQWIKTDVINRSYDRTIDITL